jgi:sugar lactone lactonase YvrE
MPFSIVIGNAGFLEAPRWYDNQLWFSDFWSRRVMSLDGDGRLHQQAYIPGQPSGLGFFEGSVFIVSTYSGHLLKLDGGVVSLFADVGAIYRGPINDMLVDSRGHAYISPLPMTPLGSPYGHIEGPGLTPLFMVDVNGTVRVVAENLHVPNGMAVTEDESTLIVAETRGQVLTAFDVARDGSLSARRVFADLGDRTPDGICIDAKGSLWVACPSTSEVLQVNSEGEITDSLATPGRWAIACALGGEDRRTLYCTTARTSRDDFREGRGTGAIEQCLVGVSGF